jgi:regulator of sigma E protease
LLLGGYVKISGMIDESMDKEQMALPPQPWEFRSKPAYQRLIIMLGGVVNFILAFIIYIGMAFAYGDTYIANSDLKDGMLIENQAMINAGFKTGIKSFRLMVQKSQSLTMTST